MSFKIYKNLAWLNGLPQPEAKAAFVGCCGSNAWARRMAEARPFAMIEDLFDAAKRIWFSLPEADRLTAFDSDPDAQTKNTASEQPGNAQTGAKIARNPDSDPLAEVTRLYEDKFGFIFILDTSGKTVDEILSICRARLGNSTQTELKIAAEEQRKITEIRLNELLEQ